MKTVNMDNVNKLAKYGLNRRPTYSEIIGMIDDNEKITSKLPNRDATMFRNSPEGSYFDGSDAMEALKEEQSRMLVRQMSDILLRQHSRTAGRTFHVERTQRLPTTSPVISQPSAPMSTDDETPAQMNQPPQPPPPQPPPQASQIQAELQQRSNTATQRRQETSMNHRGEMMRQNPPTIAQQVLNIKPPRPFIPLKPEMISIATTDESDRDIASAINSTVPTSSAQPAPAQAMKRGSPQTAVATQGKKGRPQPQEGIKRATPSSISVEPKGKETRPRLTQEGTKRGTPATVSIEDVSRTARPRLKAGKGEKRDGEGEEGGTGTRRRMKKGKGDKRYGDEPEETGRRKKGKKTKERQQMMIEGRNETTAEPTPPPPQPPRPRPPRPPRSEPQQERPARRTRGVRTTIQKPLEPDRAGIQPLREAFTNAKNRNIISSQEFEEYEREYKKWREARGNRKAPHRNKIRSMYRSMLFPKLMRQYEEANA